MMNKVLYFLLLLFFIYSTGAGPLLLAQASQFPLAFPEEEAIEEVLRTSRMKFKNVRLRPAPTEGQVRIGSVCKDGSLSKATRNGACSGHGGVAYWLYKHPDSLQIAGAVVALVPKSKRQALAPSSTLEETLEVEDVLPIPVEELPVEKEPSFRLLLYVLLIFCSFITLWISMKKLLKE
ncbi:hypothetical protein AAG747_03645 [Rapidithrix thailandica]|uniref:Uncharacterized protein n=1 Tax=Rapidithrix thailandica TaxID=413964 RepID=A0AAW9S240_9BACT